MPFPLALAKNSGFDLPDRRSHKAVGASLSADLQEKQ